MSGNQVHVAEETEYTALFYEEAHVDMAKRAQAIIGQHAGKNKILMPEELASNTANTQVGTLSDAFNLYKQLLALYPEHAYVWNGLGAAFYLKHDYQSALNCYKRAHTIAPDVEFYVFNVYRVLMALDRPSEAVAFFAEQLKIKPDHFEFLCRYADALRENGQFEESIAQIEKAQKIMPDHPGLEWSKGQNLLLLGRYVEGFKSYETRYHLGTDKLPNRDFGCPKWLGKLATEEVDIKGKTVLVHCEQGFGDTIMAGRFLKQLKEKIGKEGKLIFQTKEPMLRLFEESGADMIINALQTAGKGNIPQPDYHCLLMTLPGALGVTVDTIPPPMKVHIPEKSRRKFKFISEQCPPGAVKIGIVWSGSNNWDDNHKRGLPLDVFLRLAENPNHRVYSLQKDVHAGDLYMTHNDSYIEDIGKLCDDFSDTAAAIEQLDVVIMTDTSVAHLVGSMGKRVINLIQRLPYWIYWFDNKTRTPWYPSMELIDRNNYGKFFEQDFSVTKK